LAEPHGHYHAAPARRSFGGAAARAAADTNGDEVHHAARVDIREDVSTVFGNDGPAQVRVPDAQDEIAIETSEVGEDDGDVVSADVQFAGGDIAIEANDAVEANDAGSEGGGAGGRAGGASGGRAGEVVAAAEISVAAEIEVGGLDGGVSGGEVEVEIGGDGKSAEGDAGARRALLIYQESTAEEQIYPFTNDQLTIGRGRENDIQIKNDSKVSRYHCKLFRRGNNFYVEDIKSSNGTLVNGELITDRRLFGGEEIVIGETYFRFRIME
jgi:hypothetical protein